MASGYRFEERKSWRMRASRRLLSEWNCSTLTTMSPTRLAARSPGLIARSPAMPLVTPVAVLVFLPAKVSSIS